MVWNSLYPLGESVSLPYPKPLWVDKSFEENCSELYEDTEGILALSRKKIGEVGVAMERKYP